MGLHLEYGACEIHDDGTATVYAGTSAHGQGHHTAFAMLASDVLGIAMDKISLVNSDTKAVRSGSGTLGSRSLQTAGSAIHLASTEVLDRAKRIAGHLLEASSDDIVTGDGGLQVAGVPATSVTWETLVMASNDPTQLPPGLEPGPLRHDLDFDGGGSTFPFGAHVSVVEVDMETRRRPAAPPYRGRRLRTDPQPDARQRSTTWRHRSRRRSGVVRVGAVRR